jgi:hypothetical protein
VGWHGSGRSRISYPLLANAVQRLLTAMVASTPEETISRTAFLRRLIISTTKQAVPVRNRPLAVSRARLY